MFVSALTKQIEKQVLALPADARVELVDRLVESLNPIDDEVWNAWAPEIERRIADVRTGKVKTIPAEQVFAEARALLKRAG